MELIITVSIIAILTGLASVSYSGIRMRGRDANRKNDMSQLKVVLSTYYNAQVPAQYPASSGGTPSKITINASNDALTAAVVPAYLKVMPTDPLNTGNNVYKYQSFLTSSINTDFKLYATLENKNDTSGFCSGSWGTDCYIIQND